MKTFLVSDLHLDAAHPEIAEQFLAFLAGEARSADALYILGDLFEAWLGDDDPDPAARTARVRSLLDRGTADFVVHNDLGEISADRHVAAIHDRKGVLVRTESKEQLARELWRLLMHGGTE